MCMGPAMVLRLNRSFIDMVGSGLRHKTAPQLLLGEPPVSFLSDSTPNVSISQGSLIYGLTKETTKKRAQEYMNF